MNEHALGSCYSSRNTSQLCDTNSRKALPARAGSALKVVLKKKHYQITVLITRNYRQIITF